MDEVPEELYLPRINFFLTRDKKTASTGGQGVWGENKQGLQVEYQEGRCEQTSGSAAEVYRGFFDNLP